VQVVNQVFNTLPAEILPDDDRSQVSQADFAFDLSLGQP
jgi:hypothetical protein